MILIRTHTHFHYPLRALARTWAAGEDEDGYTIAYALCTPEHTHTSPRLQEKAAPRFTMYDYGPPNDGGE